MTRRTAVLVGLLTLLLAPGATAQAPPVKIGLLLPYTGVLSVQGTDATHGFELYLKNVGATEKQGGRIVNAIVDIPAVSQEATWGYWNKR